MTAPWQAAVYLRLSAEDRTAGQESGSIESQRSLILRALAAHPDIRVASIRTDDGFSGVNFCRPGFQAMLADIQSGRINCVVVKDLSRFGRNYIETGRYLEQLFPRWGVRFLSVTDHYDSLCKTPGQDLLLPFLNLVNDSYCRDLSRKIRSNLDARRRNGDFVGAFAVYGYQRDPHSRNRLVPEPYGAEVVREIFHRKLRGESPSIIADSLNARGILSPMEYRLSRGEAFCCPFRSRTEALWSPRAVTRILENEMYMGTLVQGRTVRPSHRSRRSRPVPVEDWVRIFRAQEPIVDPCTFRVTASLLLRDTRLPPGGSRVYPLSGLLFCGDCGAPLIRKSRNGRGYFLCQEHCLHRSCSWHRFGEDRLLAVLLRLAVHELPPFSGPMPEPSEAPDRLRLQRDRAAELCRRCREDFRRGLLDEEEYRLLLGEFSAECRRLEQLPPVPSPAPAAAIPGPDGRLRSLSRTAAVFLIDRVLLWEDQRIRVCFRFPGREAV